MYGRPSARLADEYSSPAPRRFSRLRAGRAPRHGGGEGQQMDRPPMGGRPMKIRRTESNKTGHFLPIDPQNPSKPRDTVQVALRAPTKHGHFEHAGNRTRN